MDQRSSKNNLFGILLLIAGVLLLFSNFNLIDVGARLLQRLFDLRRNVDERPAGRRAEPEFLAK